MSHLKLTSISAFFQDKLNVLDKGNNTFESKHVIHCEYDDRNIRGKLLASQKKNLRIKSFLIFFYLIFAKNLK